MKKHVYALLCAVLCSLLFPSAALSANSGYGLVMDEADLLTDSEEEALSEMLEEISLKQGNDIVVVTVYSLGGKSARALRMIISTITATDRGRQKAAYSCFTARNTEIGGSPQADSAYPLLRMTVWTT